MSSHPFSVARCLRALIVLLLAALASGCSVMDRSPPAVPLAAGARWALLPLANHTETPQAGLRAQAILESLLRQRGVPALLLPPAVAVEPGSDPSDRQLQAEAQAWASAQGARYALTGAVDEWRYKAGIDGEPAVGLVLQVIDLSSGAVVWSATGARTGWSREAVSAVAQKLLRDLLGDLSLN